MPDYAIGSPNVLASAASVYDTIDITSNTNIRDVSSMLDLWVHKKTPLLNMVQWGPESGGLQYEWLYEHTGYGYVKGAAELTEDTATGTLLLATSDVGGTANAFAQLVSGVMLLGWSSEQATHSLWFAFDAATSNAIQMTAIITGTVDAGEKLFIIGNWVNEGSEPRKDTSRARTIVTNDMAILRKDIQITGSMAATDMYAVPNELRHQTRLRLLEMQREREMAAFFSLATTTSANTRTATDTGLFRGIMSFLMEAPSDVRDATTTSLTDTDLNNVVANLWDYGSTPNAVFGSATQIRKFTGWDKSRVRSTPRENLGGHHITSYLTDIGIEVDLYPVMQFPTEVLFILDTSKIRLIPKKGRKLILEKLGKTGDYDRWQLLSEFTLEVREHTWGGCGGMFYHLG